MKRKADGTVERFGGNFPIWSDALTERGFYHIRKWGGHIVNPMNPADCMLDEPEAQAALEWMRARMWDDESYGQPLMTNYSWGGDSFASGLTATAQEGLQTSGLATTDDMPWDFDIAHEPSGPVQRSALITTDGFMAWNGTPNPDAAWEVMKWLTGVDFQRTRMETSGRIPGNRTLVENWASVVREKFPRFETVSLEVVEEALDMGYGSDDERFLDQFGANEIIGPASELVFVTGEAPVSILGDTCAEVEAVQQAYMERMGADA
jgi:ABC-type glycerol-3-phosphate transport system substrate-binding protein